MQDFIEHGKAPATKTLTWRSQPQTRRRAGFGFLDTGFLVVVAEVVIFVVVFAVVVVVDGVVEDVRSNVTADSVVVVSVSSSEAFVAPVTPKKSSISTSAM